MRGRTLRRTLVPAALGVQAEVVGALLLALQAADVAVRVGDGDDEDEVAAG